MQRAWRRQGKGETKDGIRSQEGQGNKQLGFRSTALAAPCLEPAAFKD